MKAIFITVTLWGFAALGAAQDNNEYIIKVRPEFKANFLAQLNSLGQENKADDLNCVDLVKVKLPKNSSARMQLNALSTLAGVEYVQPNFIIKPYENPSFVELRKKLPPASGHTTSFPYPDNPAFPKNGSGGTGADPLFNKQWGMNDIGVKLGWQKTTGSVDMIVAIIDTGIDYTHEDLVDNMWHNPGETGLDKNGKDKATNGIDDDGNGYVDDVIGWDFASNDNKPYDLSTDDNSIIMGEGNPGHGTHCSGNIAARGNNGKGVAGVAPNVKLMGLRFITEKGSGTTADAIKAICYAVNNGAKVLSNSWGSEGEDPSEGKENQALRDVIKFAMTKNVLFIAAAGNGHSGKGYNNDTDKAPGYPASYDIDNIISVAAIDSKDKLGSFSNWGVKTVHIAAPGVNVFSTVVGNRYNNVVLEFMGQVITWDGTSMATPHVAGAAALYWSAHPDKNWKEVKAAILGSSRKLSNLSGKLASGGKLDVDALMNY